MHLGLRQGDRDAQHTAALVRADADGREHRGITHHTSVPHLLVARIEDQILDLPKRASAPSLKLLVEQLGGTADLRRRQALDAEFAQHHLGLARRHAFDVHLRHRQHHRADRPAAAFQRLRIEGRAVMAGGLGNVDGDRACRRVDPLGLVAVGIAPTLGRPLVETRAEKPLALDLHGQLEGPAEDRGDVGRPMFDQMFQESLDRRILLPVHSTISTAGFATPWNTRMDRPCRGRPWQGRTTPPPNEFPDVRLQ